MSEPQPQNVVQATGKVATSLIDGLKGQPALIFVLALNVIVFGLIAWVGVKRSERFELILERCLPKAAELNATVTGFSP